MIVDGDDSGQDGERGREVVPAWLGVIGPVNSLTPIHGIPQLGKLWWNVYEPSHMGNAVCQVLGSGRLDA
jgi:hypothetical protein